MAKPFDQELHDKYDPKARKLAIDFCARHGLKCVPTDDKIKIDLVVNDEFYLDVEVKTCWKGDWDNFRFDKLNIPDRKKKYLNLDKPSFFMVINIDYTHAFVVEDKILRKCKLEKNPNKYNPNEEFYKVPVKRCLKYDLVGE